MSTNKSKIKAEPLALLLLALLYFFDTDGLFAAALPAVAAHEAGHYLLLRCCGAEPKRLDLGLAGLRMDYIGCLSPAREALAVGAGPAFGLGYALAASALGREYFTLSSGLSLALSIFNLLPVLPLDGGRLLCLAFPQKGGDMSLLFAASLLACALCLLCCLHTVLPAAMGTWLLWENIKNRG